MSSSDDTFEVRVGPSKRERERQALERYYDAEKLDRLVHGDRPDFVLQRHGDDPFGVEVTDLYEHEADARVEAHPKYLDDLFKGGRHMHRDDLTVLDVARVTIQDKHGNVKSTDVPAILRQIQPAEVHSAAIAEIIDRKNARFPNYAQRELSHVNLLIVDHWGEPRRVDEEYDATEFLTPELRRALRASPFREVLLMAPTRDGPWVIRPLQLLRLLEAFWMFLAAYDSFDERAADIDATAVAPLFVHAFSGRDPEGLYLGDDGRHQYAVHRGAWIRHTGEKVETIDGHDLSPPTPIDLPPAVMSEEVLARFRHHLASAFEQNRFYCGVHVKGRPIPGVDEIADGAD